MRSALKWGGLIGVASYLVVGLALTIFGAVVFGNGPASLDANPGKLTLGCVSIFLLLFACSAAGYFAGRETLNAGIGALAGLVAFAVYGVLITVYAPGSTSNVLAADTNAPGGFVSQAMALFVTVTIPLGVAALMGWLGGRPGAARGRRALAPADRAAREVDVDAAPSER